VICFQARGGFHKTPLKRFPADSKLTNDKPVIFDQVIQRLISSLDDRPEREKNCAKPVAGS
jgi:hypothetical protein